MNTLRKHSILIAGRWTAVSLEAPFWNHFKRIADERGLKLGDLAAAMDRDRRGNRSSTIRLAVLANLEFLSGATSLDLAHRDESASGTLDIVPINPDEQRPTLPPAMLDALRDLVTGELPRHGNYFVSATSKHLAKTIGALVHRDFVRIRSDRPGHSVARLNERVRSQVEAQLAAQHRTRLATEADELAKEEVA